MKAVKQLKTPFLTFGLIALAGLLAICDQSSMAGIQGSGFRAVYALGRITGFGSIFVDGVEYTTAGAQISIDSQPGSESQLRVGQIVAVTGAIQGGRTGVANQVIFTGDVRGPISQIDVVGGSLVVLGQTVHIDSKTIFGGGLVAAGLSDLQSGSNVEVSAFTEASGELLASRIDLVPAQAEVQVRGSVRNLDSGSQTFRIDNLIVDYNGVLPAGALANGSLATVVGVREPGGGNLRATQVRVGADVQGKPNEAGQLEGLVTSYQSSEQFTVGAQPVATTTATHFVLHGLTLQPNLQVRVRGSFDDSGVLVATQVVAHPHQGLP